MISIYRPGCGNYGIHAPHLHFTQDYSMGFQCEGWNDEQKDLLAMVNAVEGVKQAYQDYQAARLLLPASARLEVGPLVMSALQRNVRPTFEQAVSGYMDPDFPLVIMDDHSLPQHGWRIVIDWGVVRDGVGRA